MAAADAELDRPVALGFDGAEAELRDDVTTSAAELAPQSGDAEGDDEPTPQTEPVELEQPQAGSGNASVHSAEETPPAPDSTEPPDAVRSLFRA